jgi:zinc protease
MSWKNIKVKFYTLTLLLFIVACAAKTVPDVDFAETLAPGDFFLPFSDRVTVGSLENGFKYYIRYNDFPSDKVEIQLNVRTGSLNETDRERGIAHFVEHMAFNGTKNYESNDLIKFMEAAGLVFGKDSNAFTSYKTTRYLLTVPSDNATLIDDAFKIMRDFADGVSFDPREIEKEKGVVTEEGRSRNDAAYRMRRQSTEYIFADSLYPLREPLGLMDVVASADRALVKGYYDKWYTASNEALIVVGNIEPAAAEEMVKKYFSSMKKQETPEKASDYVPIKNELRFGLISDPEARATLFSVMLFDKRGRIDTYGRLKRYFLESGTMSMLNKRVRGAIAEKRTELSSFSGGISYHDNNMATFRFTVTTTPEGLESDLAAALAEIERAKRFGFTETEIREFAANQKTFYERAAAPDYKHQSSGYAGDLADYDSAGGTFTEFSQDKELIDKILDESDISDFNSAFNALFDSDSILVLVTVPEREREKITLNAERFKAAAAQVAAADLAPEVAENPVDKLMDKIPEGGAVKSEKVYENVGGTLITYDNGVRLFIKTNPIDNGHFAFAARKPGGNSVLKDDEARYTDLATQAAEASGFDNITMRQLQILTAGTRANVRSAVSEYMFEFIGGGDSDDMETFFQLLHKKLSAATVDENTLSAIIKPLETRLLNTEKDKRTAFFRQTTELMYNNKYRRGYLLSSDLPAITPEKLFNLYKTNFEDAGNFAFVISGDLDVQKTVELGRIYLGSLPAPEKKSFAVNRGVALAKPSGVSQGYGDVENKSTVQIRFDKDVKPLKNGEYIIPLVHRVLDRRVREDIREDKGGAYSVSVSLSYGVYPEVRFSGSLMLTCDPKRKDELISEIHVILENFTEKGITEDELSVAKAQHNAQYDSVKDVNAFWTNLISYNLVLDEEILSVDELKEIIASVTLQDAENAVAALMRDMRIYTSVFNPEESK